MRRAHKVLIVFAVLAILPSTARSDDFDRHGWYLGLNYAHGFNFIQEAVDTVSGGKLDSNDTWGLTVRGGYRLFSWLAIEANYEFMDNFTTNSVLGSTDIQANTITVGPKFLIPTWRIQPYLLLGFGTQGATLDFTSGFPRLFDDRSTSDWNAAARPALGIDFYITKHVVANLEVAGVLVAGKFENQSMSLSDPIYLSIGGGLQYRF